jgi:hypothetical protein
MNQRATGTPEQVLKFAPKDQVPIKSLSWTTQGKRS